MKLDDIKRFRQLDSKAAGHPEYRWTSGVETTTGPLGQGVATSVGMAIACAWLAAHFNRPGFELFDYDVYALAGDGDLMEGVSSEAASLAGHLRLANLCWIYDNNRDHDRRQHRPHLQRGRGDPLHRPGLERHRVGDANDLELLDGAFEAFKRDRRPADPDHRRQPHRLRRAQVQDTAKAHGEPLGEDEVRLAKRSYGWPEDAQFLVPDGVVEHFAGGIGARGRALREAWEQLFERYRAEHPELADQLERMQRRELPEAGTADLPEFPADEKGVAHARPRARC